jgi:hypothetical protein
VEYLLLFGSWAKQLRFGYLPELTPEPEYESLARALSALEEAREEISI